MHQKAISPQRQPSPAPQSKPQHTASKWLGTLLILSGLIAYALAFLRQPLVEGTVTEAGPLTRGGFVLSALVYPDAIIQSWTDAGRLPLGFADRGPIALATALWLALAALAGWPWGKLLFPEPQEANTQRSLAERLHRLAWSMLIGLAWLSTATLLVGLAGLLAVTEPVHMPLRTPLVIACAGVVAMSALIAKMFRTFLRNDPASAVLPPEHELLRTQPTELAYYEAYHDEQLVNLFDRGLVIVTRLLVMWLACVTMLGAWVPSAEFDVLEYHLQAPREFFQLGEIRFLPHNIYANMPLGIEMHTLAAMTLTGLHDTWWTGLIGKSITASFSVIGALLLGTYFATRRGRLAGSLSGWCAAGIWLASPGITHVAQLGLIDGAVATYGLAACLASVSAFQSRGRSSHFEITWWFVASVMAGAAAAAKYPGLIFAVVPMLILWLINRFQRQKSMPPETPSKSSWMRASLAQLMVLGVGLTSTCLPWYAKNAVLAGNPVYPLAASIFGGQTLTSEKVTQWQAAHRVPGSWSDTLPRLVADTWRLLVASPFVQPTMIIGFVIAGVLVLRARKAIDKSWLVWFTWSLWILAVWWCATHRIDRFWLPWTGLAAGLATLGIGWLRSQSLWLAHIVVVCGLGYGALVNSSSVVSDNRYFVSLEALRNDAGDEQQVGRISRHMAWIHSHLRDADTRLLLIGEAAVFEYQVPFLYSTCFDTNPAESILRDRSLADQQRELHRLGITHLLINWREIERYRSPGNYGFSQWPTRADIAALESDGLIRSVDMGTEAVDLYEVQLGPSPGKDGSQ